MELIDFELRGEHITLDALLKATGVASSGGAAKALVAAGGVQVDGRDELRKSCKIRAGQVVAVVGCRIKVAAASASLSDQAPFPALAIPPAPDALP